MSTSQRIAKPAAPEALLSFGSLKKNTPSRQLSSSMGARSQDARFAWISQKTALASPGSGVISVARPQAEAAMTSAVAVSPAATDATTSLATAATTTAAMTAAEAEAVARSTSRSDRRAADAVYAARSAACSGRLSSDAKKYSGEV